MLILAALLVLAAGFFGLERGGFFGVKVRRSPIILISIDTLRADRLPIYGYERIQTPAIDELAKNGTVFENCSTHVPLTLPSHTSIFTGLLPSSHGVRDNIGFKVADGAWTLATELKRAGYATGGAVSAYVLRSATGISQGFDWYDDQFEAAGPDTVLTDIRRDGSETLSRALGWLERRSKAIESKPDGRDPIFLFVHLYEPHAPYKPPERFLRNNTAPYDGAIMYADEIVGRLFAGLRSLDLYDTSLIILLSDHGEGLGDHGEATHGVFLYREVTRVPLIIKLPGSRNGGSRIQAPVQLIDIAPTVLAWAGIQPDPQLSGHTLAPALQGHEFHGDPSIYSESLYGRLHFGWSELFSLTNARYELILAPREELYDIRQDPKEVHNLLGQDTSEASARERLPRPVAVEYVKMRKELMSYVRRKGMVVPHPVDEEQIEKLRSLGYLGSQPADTEKGAKAPDPKDHIGDLSKYQLAMRMNDARMFSKAATVLEEVVVGSPRMVDAWDQLAEVYQRLGRFDKAVEALKQSLRLAPKRPQKRFKLADALIQLRRLDEARAELTAAASQEPHEANIWLAYLEIVEGQPDSARKAATRAARGIPGAVPFIEGLLSYGKQQYSKAIPLFQEALNELNGHSSRALPYLHYYLGDALARKSRTVGDQAEQAQLLREAERHLSAELSLRPTNTSAVRSLCLVHLFQHDARKVDEDLNRFASENPSAAAYGFIANLYREMKAEGRAAHWDERARQARAARDQSR